MLSATTGARAALVSGIGHCLPSDVVTNHDLAARLDTTDEWIRTRSGISERRVVAAGQATSDLATEAGRHALKSAGRDGVDLVVLATSTPDHRCPSTAPTVAARLGLGTVPAFDVDAVCSGFLYGLSVARNAVVAGQVESVLLVGADTYSTLVDPDDRTTAFLFGDGAAAVVLTAGDATRPGAVHEVELGSDGSLAELIEAPGGGPLRMQGQAVYRQAVSRMTDTARGVVERTGWTVESLDRFVGHQANQRILDAVATRLGIGADRALSNVATVGNTAAASIPLALSQAHDDGLLRPGERIALAAFGGGVTWGAATLTWPDL
ncbi:beta-ketoacyl-ACP synthase III [Pseudonocardia endophytica]|uniref:Beta-ketoacyl-[acyl-carrier-protein] synthase III n=1 Tax=Pseudonocardia endophytica TaxID=401976 RepID=A0A4R1HWA9_PSEEN|nr:beta-ketoacyl-ACP synthase III [Pseudonocardia endophytica]TCK27034.1 3-oxoacyl-[acyl-carrier-protein] synthase III [Pseudonocardia endophytica]